MHKQGFSLIELVVVVAILAILTAIAVPRYSEYLVEGNRADVKAELLRISDRLEEFKVVNRVYTGFDFTNAGIQAASSVAFPLTGTANYTINILDLGVATYTLTATPVETSIQNGDGVVCINEENQKFWSKGATACSFSAISTWD